jgi:CheY-like chemotaxis protein
MRVLFLTNDLLFASRAAQAAQDAGARLQTAASSAALLELAEADPTEAGELRLVIVDLSAPDCPLEELLESLGQITPHARPPEIVAYAPHVFEGKLAAARAAGCGQVLTRGQFDRQLAALIEQACQPESPA